MAKIQYQKLNVLVADDFSNFRSTVSRMLMDLGVVNVDMASNSEEILAQCSRKRYDVVLCDYNLGTGRCGQHVLEELRFNNYLGIRGIFILVSAESSRNIVMSAYDSAPDDYLMKPITTKMLHNRLERQLQLRQALSSVYSALEKQDSQTAIDILVDLSIAEDRYSTYAQKMLGELFLAHGQFRQAEKLYKRVLEVRELDWARLGLAKAKQLQGDLEQAGLWLEKIINDNYLYLPAYDVLSDNWLERGDALQAQSVVQQSVEVSPMSILRQKNLATLADKNEDLEIAVESRRKVVKLGKLSCYGKPDDKLDLVRSLSKALERDIHFSANIINEAFNSTEVMGESEEGSIVQRAQLLYLASRLRAAKGDKDRAQYLLLQGETSLHPEDSNIDIEVDHIRALLALGLNQRVEELLHRLQKLYENNQEALERLDEFLDEPVSILNKSIVAEVNREGIDLYNNGYFDEALDCFDKAKLLFPKHIGLQLNIVQALIGKLKTNANDDDSSTQCRRVLELISSVIDSEHSQYKRFTLLKNMARELFESA